MGISKVVAGLAIAALSMFVLGSAPAAAELGDRSSSGVNADDAWDAPSWATDDTSKEVDLLLADLGRYTDDGDVGVVPDIDGRPSGFASLVIRPDEAAIDLHWKGELPAQVQTILDNHPRVTVNLYDSPRNLAEYIELRDRVASLFRDGRFAPLLVQAVWANPMEDTVHVVLQSTPEASDSQFDLEKELESNLGINVIVDPNDGEAQTGPAGSRQSTTKAPRSLVNTGIEGLPRRDNGSWRWGESNPRPSLRDGVFSGRSL